MGLSMVVNPQDSIYYEGQQHEVHNLMPSADSRKQRDEWYG